MKASTSCGWLERNFNHIFRIFLFHFSKSLTQLRTIEMENSTSIKLHEFYRPKLIQLIRNRTVICSLRSILQKMWSLFINIPERGIQIFIYFFSFNKKSKCWIWVKWITFSGCPIPSLQSGFNRFYKCAAIVNQLKWSESNIYYRDFL